MNASVRATINLSNHFLMAMPGMSDPNFESTVILIAEHNDDGALGLIINRPMELTLKDLFAKVELPLVGPLTEQVVVFGGPVHTDRGFVLHRPGGRWSSTIEVGDAVALTSSKDVLQALSDGDGPRQVLVTLGCARWGAGQLEEELAANVWLSVAADAQIIFDTPTEQRFGRAYSLLGIDPTLMSGAAGHA